MLPFTKKKRQRLGTVEKHNRFLQYRLLELWWKWIRKWKRDFTISDTPLKSFFHFSLFLFHGKAFIWLGNMGKSSSMCIYHRQCLYTHYMQIGSTYPFQMSFHVEWVGRTVKCPNCDRTTYKYPLISVWFFLSLVLFTLHHLSEHIHMKVEIYYI